MNCVALAASKCNQDSLIKIRRPGERLIPLFSRSIGIHACDPDLGDGKHCRVGWACYIQGGLSQPDVFTITRSDDSVKNRDGRVTEY